MRALVLADRPPDTDLGELLKEEPDLVICLGDLDLDILAPLLKLQEDRERAGMLPLPGIGIYGNHCGDDYLATLGIHDADGRYFKHRSGLSFVGLSGCIRYKKGDGYLRTQEEMAKIVSRLPQADVVISHAPPWGINDEPENQSHHGVKALRRYVETESPQLLLHGHTYPEQPVETLGQTNIIYVSGHAWVELPSRSLTEELAT